MGFLFLLAGSKGTCSPGPDASKKECKGGQNDDDDDKKSGASPPIVSATSILGQLLAFAVFFVI